MARRPLTRIDGEPAGKALESGRSRPPPPTRPGRSAPILTVTARLRSFGPPQVWLGAGCLLILLGFLARGPGGDETGRGPVERATSDAPQAIVATLAIPAADQRPVRRICDDEGLPDALCARSAQCAGSQPAPPAGPRVIRLFLKAPSEGGCG